MGRFTVLKKGPRINGTWSEYFDLGDEELHGTGEEGVSRLAQRPWGQRE